MPRFLIERTFSLEAGLCMPGWDQSVQTHLDLIENNRLEGVTWLHSYIAPDGTKSFCLDDGPTPEAVLNAAQRNGMPIDRISEVHVLMPDTTPFSAASRAKNPLDSAVAD